MTDFEQRYVTARKAVIARDLARLNPMQRQGAMTTEGPLLLLAGAGSGKTTVLIQRVYNLLTYGRGRRGTQPGQGPHRNRWWSRRPHGGRDAPHKAFGAPPGSARR